MIVSIVNVTRSKKGHLNTIVSHGKGLPEGRKPCRKFCPDDRYVNESETNRFLQE